MPSLNDAIREFLLDCRSRLSPKTVAWYQWHLEQFSLSLDTKQDIERVGSLPIREYLIYMKEAKGHYRGSSTASGPLSPQTQAGRFRSLKRFFLWAWIEYELDPKTNPIRKVKGPKRGDIPPKAVAISDIELMLAACKLNNPLDIRARAIVLFLLDTGCRASGLTGLTVDHLDLDHGRAILTEKGDKTRAVIFSTRTSGAIRHWLLVRPVKSEFLFSSDEGKQLTVSGLREILRRLAARAGVSGRVTIHGFRHAYAREFLTNGGSLAALQQLLGHSSPTVTIAFYARWDLKELTEQARQYSPVKNLKERR